MNEYIDSEWQCNNHWTQTSENTGEYSVCILTQNIRKKQNRIGSEEISGIRKLRKFQELGNWGNFRNQGTKGKYRHQGTKG